MHWLLDAFARSQEALFESLVQPLMFALGMGNLLEDGFAATGWLIVGLLQITCMLLLLAPLERLRPVQTILDRKAVRVDVIYTLIHRLGLFQVAMFFTILPVTDTVFGTLRANGMGTWHVDQLWPGVTDIPLVSFAIYLVVFDFLDYWLHRAEHQLKPLWALHAVHHAQRSMTMWSDNRDHLLASALRTLVMVVAAQAIGVAPGQFIGLVALTQLSESLQHANVRLSFGRIGERLWVSPRFHRLHHAIGIGHESAAGKSTLGGCNFGVLLPWWDMLFGTANFSAHLEPTGIRDQVEPDAEGRLRDYGQGFFSQQWLGLRRLVGAA